MSAKNFGAQDVSSLYMNGYCGNAAAALIIYDWLLCLADEVRFVWGSKLNAAPLVYAFSRYALLIQSALAVATEYPMSDLSCRGNAWAQVVARILGTLAFGTFSALRAYALSNKNVWLTAAIFLLALPPSAMAVLQCVYLAPQNLPSPINCSPSHSVSEALSVSVSAASRGSQLAAELLVIGVTWWYTYQSYRIRQGVKMGRTISSLLFYNGSLYFLFLAMLYMLDIVLNTASLPSEISNARSFLSTFYDPFLVQFYDPITSILTCRFILSLRRFDSTIASFSVPGSQVPGHTASTALDFVAQPSGGLPSFIASFVHPVHVDPFLSDLDLDAMRDDSGGAEWRDGDGETRSD